MKKEILKALDKFGIEYYIHFDRATENNEFLSLIISYDNKRIDGRHRKGRLLKELFNINYRAYFHKGILHLSTK